MTSGRRTMTSEASLEPGGASCAQPRQLERQDQGGDPARMERAARGNDARREVSLLPSAGDPCTQAARARLREQACATCVPKRQGCAHARRRSGAEAGGPVGVAARLPSGGEPTLPRPRTRRWPARGQPSLPPRSRASKCGRAFVRDCVLDRTPRDGDGRPRRRAMLCESPREATRGRAPVDRRPRRVGRFPRARAGRGAMRRGRKRASGGGRRCARGRRRVKQATRVPAEGVAALDLRLPPRGRAGRDPVFSSLRQVETRLRIVSRMG